MRYLLDSNIVTAIYDRSSRDHAAVCSRLASLRDDDEVFVSIITLYEFEYGLANAPDDKRESVEKKLSETVRDFGVLRLSLDGAKAFGSMKTGLRKRQGLTQKAAKKHNIDVMIAATAIVSGCLLVSADALHTLLGDTFSSLTVENWLL